MEWASNRAGAPEGKPARREPRSTKQGVGGEIDHKRIVT